MIANLNGKSALITGGASGIGRGISLALASQGSNVAITDMNIEGASKVADEVKKLGRQSIAIKVDVTDSASITTMVDKTVEEFTHIDILVNDAGVVGQSKWFMRNSPSDEDWDLVHRVNVRGVVKVSEAITPMMIKRQYGKIINIASMASRYGSADLPHYAASKSAVVSLTRSNALQMASHNINVNAICPGVLWTPMWEQIALLRSRIDEDPEFQNLTGREYFEKTVDSLIPLKREQTPEDIGSLAAFLASDDAKNITGQAIQVDGGRVMV